MPKLIGEDEFTKTYQLDNGQPVTVAKGGLSELPQPLPSAPLAMDAPSFDPVQARNALLTQGNISDQNKINLMNRSGVALDPTKASDALLAAGVQPRMPVESIPGFVPAEPIKPLPAQVPEQVTPKEPDEPSLMEQGYERQMRGIQKEADAAYSQGQKEAAARQGYADQLADLEKQKADNFQKANEATDSKIADYEKMKQDFRDTVIKDPWAERSTGAKIGAALAIGFGAFGGALTGQPNAALQIINDSINRDLQIQSKNLETKKAAVSDAIDSIKIVKDKFATRDQQLMALKDMKLESVVNQIEGLKAKTKSAEAQARADQMIGALQRDRVQNAVNLRNSMVEMQLKAQQPNEYFVPGLGMAQSKAGAEALRQMVGEVNGAKKGIDELITIVDTPGKSFDPKLDAKAKSIQTTLIGQLRTALTGPGAMSEGDKKLLESAIPDPTAVFSLDSKTKMKLQELKKALDRKLAAASQASGITQAEEKIQGMNPQPVDQRAQAIQWLRANPSDPRAPAIAQKLGLK